MASIDFQDGMVPSLLDRLTDPESAGTAIMSGYSHDKMYRSVLRDLADLLNTHRSVPRVGDEFPEVKTSIVCFGLPDIASFELTSTATRQAVGDAIFEVITVYEPRLRDVLVHVLNPGEDLTTQSLRFRVEARLSVDPSPEYAFDTILEIASGQYVVSPTSNE
ncbi:type VI secretion system baseplate subunit TssE [Zavarzinella formosa]|uniref:type VI secretion system baseplate subunit TssE n=1 Tax=Zavarzinella formosa TaxID=360055 RepID=UPI000306B8D6|nr:type VI secretion system baseplate subunit TssE [Zavarzinella formosa]